METGRKSHIETWIGESLNYVKNPSEIPVETVYEPEIPDPMLFNMESIESYSEIDTWSIEHSHNTDMELDNWSDPTDFVTDEGYLLTATKDDDSGISW